MLHLPERYRNTGESTSINNLVTISPESKHKMCLESTVLPILHLSWTGILQERH